MQQYLASRPALKLLVKEEGWYRATQSELVAAGLSSFEFLGVINSDGQDWTHLITADEAKQILSKAVREAGRR